MTLDAWFWTPVLALLLGVLALAPLGEQVLARGVVFIDLAVAYRAPLLSKDRAVLSMAKRLLTLGVVVASGWGAIA